MVVVVTVTMTMIVGRGSFLKLVLMFEFVAVMAACFGLLNGR